MSKGIEFTGVMIVLAHYLGGIYFVIDGAASKEFAPVLAGFILLLVAYKILSGIDFEDEQWLHHSFCNHSGGNNEAKNEILEWLLLVPTNGYYWSRFDYGRCLE
jgi:hypothetical protein